MGISGIDAAAWYGDTYGRTLGVVAERFAEVARLPPADVACGFPNRETSAGDSTEVAAADVIDAARWSSVVEHGSLALRLRAGRTSYSGTKAPHPPPLPRRRRSRPPPPTPRPPSPPLPPPPPQPPPSPPPQPPPPPLVVPVHVLVAEEEALARLETLGSSILNPTREEGDIATPALLSCLDGAMRADATTVRRRRRRTRSRATRRKSRCGSRLSWSLCRTRTQSFCTATAQPRSTR